MIAPLSRVSPYLVLVVDDDPIMRRMCHRALAGERLRVEEAVDGQQGLAAFARLRPDLVLLDGMMPELDGFAACAALRKLPGGDSVPILLVTALDDEQSVDRAFNAGATDYVTKPVHWGVLRQRVRRLLQASLVDAMQARMEAVVRSALDGILICTEQGDIVENNASAERIFGYAAGELVSQNIGAVLGAPEGSALPAPGTEGELQSRRKDGAAIVLQFTASAFAVHGEQGLVVTLLDITARKKAEIALRDSEALYRSVITSMAEGVIVVDWRGRFISHNASAEHILGLSSDVLKGSSLRDPRWSVIREDGAVFPQNEFPGFVTLRTGRPQEQVVMGVRRPDGSLVWLMINTQPLYRAGATAPSGAVISFTDTTEQLMLMQELRHSSSHDMLTGLYNRAYFEEEIQRLEPSRQFPVSIVMVDVDGMKAANDTLGHMGGDEILRQTARLLRSAFRAEDMVARIGGDEFAIILPRTDEATSHDVIQRVRDQLAARKSTDGDLPLVLSLGVATANVGAPLTEAWKEADRRMYQDKRARRSPRS